MRVPYLHSLLGRFYLEAKGFLDLGNAGFRFCGATLVVGTSEGFAGGNRDLEIELDLRFGT